MKLLKIAILSVLLIICVNSYSQRDSLYVRNFHEKLIVKPFIGAPTFSLEFVPVFGHDSAVISYEPNTYGIIGIDLAYRAVSISISGKAGDLEERQKYGESDYKSLFARFTYRKFAFEGQYRDYQGYADLNTRNYYKALPDSTPFFIRHDLRSRYLKFKTTYQFNLRKYSYPAAFSFTEQQRKSAITPMLIGTINRFNMSADSSFFPGVIQNHYGKLKSMNEIKTFGIGFAPGFAFNVVWKKLFFSGILFLGLDFQHQKYYLVESGSWNSGFRVAPLGDSRFSLGINGNKVVAAITVKNDINNFVLSTFASKTTYTMVTFDLGFRFNAPRGLRKIYDKTGEKTKSITKGIPLI